MNRRISTLALVAMVVGAVVMVYPYAYMVGSSFKTRKEFAQDKESLIPARFQVGERLKAWRGEPSALDWPGADWSPGAIACSGRSAVAGSATSMKRTMRATASSASPAGSRYSCCRTG